MPCDENCWGHFISESGILHLNKYRVSLGRRSNNDLVIEDKYNTKMISAQHAVVLQVGSGAIILDTSLNGTYVNNRRVQRCILKCNDTVRFGKSRICGERIDPFRFIYTSKPIVSAFGSQAMDSCSVEKSGLRECLKCPICRDFLTFPAELSPCSHLSCSECVEKFTLYDASPRCPVCDGLLNSFKLKIKYNFTSIVHKAMNFLLSERELEIYAERFSRRKADLVQRQSSLDELRVKGEKMMQRSNGKILSDPFLLVCQTWTAYEKQKFQRGIAKFPIGEGRELFCWMVRLTEHWVKFDANETDISVALLNLDLLQDRSLEESKDTLVRFIHNKRIAS